MTALEDARQAIFGVLMYPAWNLEHNIFDIEANTDEIVRRLQNLGMTFPEEGTMDMGDMIEAVVKTGEQEAAGPMDETWFTPPTTYQDKALALVYDYVKTRLEKTDTHINFRPDDVYLVWFSKTLANWKALISTTLPDGMYYEVTYNGAKDEAYIDAYKKFDNVCVPNLGDAPVADNFVSAAQALFGKVRPTGK